MSRRRPRQRIAVLGIKALPARAGADRVVERLLDHFSADNDYTIYLVKTDKQVAACRQNLRYVYVPALKGKYLRAPSYFFLCCIHFLWKGRYDVAHVHNSDFGLFCPILRLSRRVYIVGTFHGDPYTRAKWGAIARQVLLCSERIFVWSCDALTSVAPGKTATGRPISYIPNGVDPRTPNSGEDAFPLPALNLQQEEYVMFACGRLDRTKGLHHLLRAYRESEVDAKLLAIGDFTHDARYAGDIERMASSDDRVVLHKKLLHREALLRVIDHCAVFVFPSEVEAMSMMLLEAIACRKLVVCSDIPANIAVVGRDYPFLFRSRDRSALRATLENALSERESWDAQPLVDRVAAEFRWDRIAAAYESVFERGQRGATDTVIAPEAASVGESSSGSEEP